MPVAFVLINAEIGEEGQVLKALRKVENVKEAYLIYGVYDIIARVERLVEGLRPAPLAESMEKLKEIVTWKMRKLDKVRSTLTMIVIEGA